MIVYELKETRLSFQSSITRRDTRKTLKSYVGEGSRIYGGEYFCTQLSIVPASHLVQMYWSEISLRIILYTRSRVRALLALRLHPCYIIDARMVVSRRKRVPSSQCDNNEECEHSLQPFVLMCPIFFHFVYVSLLCVPFCFSVCTVHMYVRTLSCLICPFFAFFKGSPLLFDSYIILVSPSSIHSP